MYICSLCKLNKDMTLAYEEQQNVKKGHFKLKLHINNFNEKIKIKINKSIEDKFVDIIFDFNKLVNNHIYSHLHFKDIIIEKIKENQKENKNYKYTILKICKIKDDLRDGEIRDRYLFQTTKITSYNIIKDIYNLEYFEGLELNDNLIEDKILQKYENEITEKYNNIKNTERYKETIKYLKRNNVTDDRIKNNNELIINHVNNNGKNNISLIKEISENEDVKDLNDKYSVIRSGVIKTSGGTINLSDNLDISKLINLRCVIKMTEYIPISGGNISELNKIPELFLNKRSLLILRNNDDKCFLHCYIRKFLNPIAKNSFRITKRDKEIANEIINETNLTFENVSINEMNKIEKKIEININVFSCNKNYKNKNPVRKSKENYDKILDLLLIEDINHYIIIKNLHCFFNK